MFGHRYFGGRYFGPRYFGPGVDVEPTPDPEPAECGNDLLSRGMAFLATQLQTHASQPIVYQRGDERIALCATFGRKLLKLNDGMGGSRLEWTDRDFIVPSSSLVLSGGAATPRRGDRVRVNIGGGVIQTYEVTAPGNEPPWQWCDPFRKMIRIHAKLVDE